MSTFALQSLSTLRQMGDKQSVAATTAIVKFAPLEPSTPLYGITLGKDKAPVSGFSSVWDATTSTVTYTIHIDYAQLPPDSHASYEAGQLPLLLLGMARTITPAEYAQLGQFMRTTPFVLQPTPWLQLGNGIELTPIAYAACSGVYSCGQQVWDCNTCADGSICDRIKCDDGITACSCNLTCNAIETNTACSAQNSCTSGCTGSFDCEVGSSCTESAPATNCPVGQIFCGGCIGACRANTQTCTQWIDQECGGSGGGGVMRQPSE